MVNKILANFICQLNMNREPNICNVLYRRESSDLSRKHWFLEKDTHTFIVPLSWDAVLFPTPATEFKGSLGNYDWHDELNEVFRLVWGDPVSSNTEPAPWISSSFLVANGFCPPQEQLSAQVILTASHCGQCLSRELERQQKQQGCTDIQCHWG